jgi:hypothetical protein
MNMDVIYVYTSIGAAQLHLNVMYINYLFVIFILVMLVEHS